MIEKTRNRESVLAIVKRPDGKIKIIRGMADKYNVIAIVKDKFGELKSMVMGQNIVTDAGDLFYAQKGCGTSPTNTFINCYLGTATAAEGKTSTYTTLTVISGSEKAPTATYPKVNDGDTANTGKAADSITYKYEWLGADFNNAAIACGGIAKAGASGTDPLLTHFKFTAAFEKTATDTLTLYVNHNFLGV